MSPVFSPDIIARVKDETDIVEIVRQHVSLKQAGSVFKGLCPFHKEKTPSFIVTPARQRYHCFGCATGGDVITFLMEIEGLTFPEAVEILARPLDIDLSNWLREDEGEGERRAFHRANEAAMNIWRDALWDKSLGSAALKYLKDRGFSEKVLRDFDVGWAPGGPGWLEEGLKKAGVDRELALSADLLRPSDRGGGALCLFPQPYYLSDQEHLPAGRGFRRQGSRPGGTEVPELLRQHLFFQGEAPLRIRRLPDGRLA